MKNRTIQESFTMGSTQFAPEPITSSTAFSDASAGKNNCGIEHIKSIGSKDLVLSSVSVHRDNGDSIIAPFDLRLKPGDCMALGGDSGSGKTTLITAIVGRGLHKHGAGTVTTPANAKVLCIPQRAYQPDLSLKGIVCYPKKADDFSNEAVEEALRAVFPKQKDLDVVLPLLDKPDNESRNGVKKLAAGYQNRLVYARELLLQPDILLIDETPSSLGNDEEENLLNVLRERMPHSIFIIATQRDDKDIPAIFNVRAHIADGQMTIRRLGAAKPSQELKASL
jgi:putative ATP-binding cassette transporter